MDYHPQEILEDMIDEAIENRGSSDNVTAILICFNRFYE